MLGVVRDRLADDTIGTGYSHRDAGSVFLAALLGRTDFAVGVDVNDTGTAQTLSIVFLPQPYPAYGSGVFTGGATGNIPSINNGTGFPDYTLTGFDINRGDISWRRRSLSSRASRARTTVPTASSWCRKRLLFRAQFWARVYPALLPVCLLFWD